MAEILIYLDKALAVKAKAMYGKRLKGSDYRQMAAMSSVDGVIEYLRRHSVWGRAVDKPGGQVSRAQLERALQDQAGEEYARLIRFVPRGDKVLASFPFLLADAREIMNALRRLQAGTEAEHIPAAPAGPGRIDRTRLAGCVDYDSLLAAVRGSIYDTPLRRIRPERPGQLPDYTTAEALLKSAYYAYIYRLIRRHCTGQARRLLLKSFGREIDFLNLLHVLRLKRFFPEEQTYFSVLFPFHDRLKPPMLRAICAAPSMEAALRLVGDTPYGPIFRGMDLRGMELEYRRQIYAFHRRQLALGAPPVCMAAAYLNLMDQEIKAIIHVVESVYYGVPCGKSIFDLTGE